MILVMLSAWASVLVAVFIFLLSFYMTGRLSFSELLIVSIVFFIIETVVLIIYLIKISRILREDWEPPKPKSRR